MQASDRLLARRYARALFDAAIDHREEERVGRDLPEICRVVQQNIAIFQNPVLGALRQQAHLKKLLGPETTRRTQRFLEVLAEKKRLALLPAAVVEYGRLLDEKRSVARARVRSAAALSPQEEGALRQRLERLTGKKIEMDVKVDGELLGGAVVRIGDWVLDGSLQGRIRRLGAELASAGR